ncbi:hypothetical protein AOX59_07420 [Lentibacillus amyloliquefaciens]|uniref:YdhG-like domain-containing protein n=2 Tax=Lentibacillus amyloliquefaciens TaxID=1472767 RepID=A0A0U4FRH8_9BACI|nr:DUF1801 domain-containing protein [Lentibacillus amyloliquefaciens]ALX48453.1 hypothetical protein AOX59_07420 [Lentibacillus amyloliquefaciens]
MSDVNQYLDNVETKWKDAFIQLKEVVDQNIPNGFALDMQYGMPSYVIPLAVYPDGYLGKKDTPLPFISIAAQKKHIAVYHMGMYADDELLNWFQTEYPNHMDTKLNMGKSCIRFTNPKKIPYQLIGELVSKMTADDWINIYEGKKKK